MVVMSACDKPAIDASQSLVGAKQLPVASVLSREVIYVNRGSVGPTSDSLSYELRPDNTLIITLTHRDTDTFKEVTDGKETFDLSSNVASQARHGLWRLRPATLQGIEWLVRPADCPPPPTDTFPEATVAFIDKGAKPGVEDDRLGAVEIPAQYTCDTRQGREARELIERVLRSFPQSKVAAEFNRRLTFTLTPR
jgi:hypothetical protein